MPDVAPFCLHSSTATADDMIATAMAAARAGLDDFQTLLDGLPAPAFVTDAGGWITHFNRACVAFAGRTPVPGRDRWCVTERLYTESGASLPHDRGPMAVAIKEERPVRGAVAIAERPDGTRILFTPYPTPIVDDDGAVIGAINILIDITDRRQADALKAQARRCHRLAQSITDARTIETLKLMAAQYEEEARAVARRLEHS